MREWQGGLARTVSAALALRLYMPGVLVLERIPAQQQAAGHRSTVRAVAVTVLLRLVMGVLAFLPVLVVQEVTLSMVH